MQLEFFNTIHLSGSPLVEATEQASKQDEIWKDVYGFEGFYQVSNTGAVRSLTRTIKYHNNTYKGRVLKMVFNHRGYAAVAFSVNNKHTTKAVHRLIATAFIPNPENKPQVNHIDNNPSNNSVENLIWGTQQENMKHCSKSNRCSIAYAHKLAIKKISKPVSKYNMNGLFIKTYVSIWAAARENNLTPTCIIYAARGKYKHSGGFKWKYEKKVA